MTENKGAGEQAAQIIEAIETGADEAAVEPLDEVARELRAPEIDEWDEAEQIIEERQADAPTPVAELLDEAVSAVRGRAIDD